jgi:hypothetical protein
MTLIDVLLLIGGVSSSLLIIVGTAFVINKLIVLGHED